MTYEIAFVFGLLLVALVLFATERVPIDQVALALPVVLLVAGIIDAEAALSGLAHPATVTVAAMLVLGLGLTRTGAVDAVSAWARSAPLGDPAVRLLVLCLIVGAVSPFLNNTAVVVIFLPVFLGVAKSFDVAPSRMLIPLSYSAILGGTITILGTSTNLVVHGIARDHGLTELTLFSITPLGIVYLGIGVLYLFTVGRWLLPDRREAAAAFDRYGVRRFTVELRVTEESDVAGSSLAELGWGVDPGIPVLGIQRGERLIRAPGGRRVVAPGDVLIVMGEMEEVLALAGDHGLQTSADRDREVGEGWLEEGPLVEFLLSSGSMLIGRTLRDVSFRQRHDGVVLGIAHHGMPVAGRLPDVRLDVGDILLVYGSPEALNRFADEPGIVPLGEVELPPTDRPRARLAVSIMAGVVLGAGVGLVPILHAALAGVVLMLFTGCLRMTDIYGELDWTVVFLLAGLLPLGAAMEDTGAALLIGSWTADLLGALGPGAAILAFYLITSILTEVLSNNAAAVVLTPVALLTAAELGMNPYALLVAVMFGASASFMTPVGYQTNTLVFGPGGYRFTDFLRVGAPLNAVLALTAALLIPIFWPS